MLTFHKYANADAAVINLLKNLGIQINPQDIIEELEKHPDHPSMLAISDVLNWFEIDNAAYRINADELADLTPPFIAHTKRNNDFVTVNKIADDKVTLSDHKKNNYTLLLDDFKKMYNGVVLSAEVDKKKVAFKSNWTDTLATYKTPAAIFGLSFSFLIILFLYSDYTTNLNWVIVALSLLKTAGLITSILLLVQSIDKNNPLVQTLCGGGGKTNCNAILTSKAATVFKGLTWSEIGFFYWAGTWLALFFAGTHAGVLQTLAILNIISLPYTVYSINYQARVAKQWCVLCTTIQALLWLEFIPLMTILKLPLHISAGSLIAIVIALVIPATFWMLLKPLLLKKQELNTLKNQTRKFKYNQDFFNATLKEQAKYAIPADDWSIVLGNKEANTIFTMVSNPYCQPCSKAHAEFEELLEKLDDIQLRIVFTANNTDHDRKTPIARHIMALKDQYAENMVRLALHDWYGQRQKSYEEWAKLYPVKLDSSKFSTLEKQHEWCKVAEIKATPTILVNGYQLPKAYRLHDIKYMLN